MKNNIIGYFVDKNEEKTPSTIFVAINEISDTKGNITSYCPIGQHSSLSKKYLKECVKISKNEYIDCSKGIYTPEEYLT